MDPPPTFLEVETARFFNCTLPLKLLKNKPAAQAQTNPDATPPIGQIHPTSKMTVNFEPLKGF